MKEERKTENKQETQIENKKKREGEWIMSQDWWVLSFELLVLATIAKYC